MAPLDLLLLTFDFTRALLYYDAMPKTWKTVKASEVTLTVSGRNNVYLVKSGQTVMLVDAGMAYMYANLVYKLNRLGARPSIIAITHAHYDHAENAYRLKELFKSKILAHKSEAGHLSAGVNPEDDPFAYISVADDEHYKPVKTDIIVEDGFEMSGIKILHTPGHTPGSISILVDNEIACVGDSMFSVYPGQAMVPYVMDRGILLQSWKRLFDTGCKLFLPSHGRPITRETAELEFARYTK